jgi:glutamate formiminotransferase / 5-formyltetrahydrofolate cyclo-ligase
VAATLLSVPNVSEGRDAGRIAGLERAFGAAATLLDRHSDDDHNRTVLTLAGDPEELRRALAAGAAEAIESIDMRSHEGVHPAIGALDVCPVVWLSPAERDPALALAREIAADLGALGLPVFFYGELASSPSRAERAHFRRGGTAELGRRMRAGELSADRGPGLPHPTAGATLVTARPPLGAFNVELEGGDLELGRAIAAGLRESGGGPAGVRAIGLPLASGRVQVSINLHDPIATPLGEVVELIRAQATPARARPVEAELIGLIPAAALVDYPTDVPIRDFDPDRQTIERRLAALG